MGGAGNGPRGHRPGAERAGVRSDEAGSFGSATWPVYLAMAASGIAGRRASRAVFILAPVDGTESPYACLATVSPSRARCSTRVASIPRARVWAQPGYPWYLTGPARLFETIADDQGRYRLVLESLRVRHRHPRAGMLQAVDRSADPILRRDIRLSLVVLGVGPLGSCRPEPRTRWPAPMKIQLLRRRRPLAYRPHRMEAGSARSRRRGRQLSAIRYSGSAATVQLPLTIGTLDRVDGIVLHLGDGVSLRGRITDPSGQGIGGVKVRLVVSDALPGEMVIAPVTRTTLDGAYRLAGVASARTLSPGGRRR